MNTTTHTETSATSSLNPLENLINTAKALFEEGKEAVNHQLALEKFEFAEILLREVVNHNTKVNSNGNYYETSLYIKILEKLAKRNKDLSNWDQARSWCEKGLQLDENHVRFNLYMGNVCMEKGEWELALYYLRTAEHFEDQDKPKVRRLIKKSLSTIENRLVNSCLEQMSLDDEDQLCFLQEQFPNRDVEYELSKLVESQESELKQFESYCLKRKQEELVRTEMEQIQAFYQEELMRKTQCATEGCETDWIMGEEIIYMSDEDEE